MEHETCKPLTPIAVRTREAAEMLGLSERSLLRLRDSEGIPYSKVGTASLYSVDGLREWLSQQTIKTRTALPQTVKDVTHANEA